MKTDMPADEVKRSLMDALAVIMRRSQEDAERALHVLSAVKCMGKKWVPAKKCKLVIMKPYVIRSNFLGTRSAPVVSLWTGYGWSDVHGHIGTGPIEVLV